ncbi:MAG: glycosyltransferase family 4 protein [Rhizobiaceae bacterium]|nr:glycosyltransferase family 4 protein [Rhizobiaceae bacterium]
MRPFYLGKEWVRLGHNVTCFVSRNHHLMDQPDPLPERETVGGVPFVSLPARAYAGNGAGRALNMLDFCRSMLRLPSDLPRPDAIIVSSPHPFPIFPAARLARRYGAKLVFEIRDMWPLSIIEMTKTPRWHPITIAAWAAERFACRNADVIGSLLGNAEPFLRERGFRGRFVHAPNGVSDDEVAATLAPSTPQGKAAAERLALWRREGRLIVIHPGTQGYPSALDILLKSVANAAGERGSQPFGLLLVGGGDTADTLKQLTNRLGLNEDVFFVPPVPKPEALWLTAHSDIGYAGKRNFRSVFEHGISFNKIIDFMQVGLPIILPVTTAGDPVSASGCGIVTGDDPGDIARALLALADMSAEERMEMGRKGREYAERSLSFRQIAADYIEAIAS